MSSGKIYHRIFQVKRGWLSLQNACQTGTTTRSPDKDEQGVEAKGDLTTEEILDFSLGIGLLFVIRKEDVEYLNNKLKETGIKGLHIGHVQIKKDSKLQIQNLKVNLYKSWTKTEKRDRIAVFIENKDASLQKTFKGEKDRIRLVVLTSSFAKAKDEAEQEGISTNVLERKDFASEEDFSSSVIRCLNEAGINFLICYESSLSDDCIQEFGHHRCLMTSVGLIQKKEEKKTCTVEQVHTLLCTESKVTGVTVYFSNVLERKDFASEEDFSSSVIRCLNEAGINFLICYESSLSDDCIQEFGHHRCLMTSVGLIQKKEEKKTCTVEQVHTLLCTESKVTGVTVYFSNDTDDANIQINQQRIIKIKNDNTETLTAKILQELDISILNALKGH